MRYSVTSQNVQYGRCCEPFAVPRAGSFRVEGASDGVAADSGCVHHHRTTFGGSVARESAGALPY